MLSSTHGNNLELYESELIIIPSFNGTFFDDAKSGLKIDAEVRTINFDVDSSYYLMYEITLSVYAGITSTTFRFPIVVKYGIV